MYLNIIHSYRDVVAICDAELLGKTFEQDKFQLNIKENFYKGAENNQPVSEEQALKILKNMKAEDATFNIVGKKSIQTAIQAGVIDENSILKIQGIPFSLVLI